MKTFILFVCCIVSFGISVPLFASVKEDTEKLPVTVSESDIVNVIASRLPSFTTKLNEIPSNVTYLGRQNLKNVQSSRFQDTIQQIEGASFNDNVGNGWDTNFGLRGF